MANAMRIRSELYNACLKKNDKWLR